MKAGIITLHGDFNYGNRLQSYAAQQICKNLGFDTDEIYIQSWKCVVYQHYTDLNYKIKSCCLKSVSQKRVMYHSRCLAFRKFTRKHICTKRYQSVEKIKGYDYYFLGSDQVWNPKRYNATKKNLFLLTFTEPEKKICLSPSFGQSTLPDEWKEYFRENLNTFPNLSVRERAGADIIMELTGRKAEVLIDPTLMLSQDDWLKIARKPKKVDTDGKYVLTYFLGDVPQKAQADSVRIKNLIGGEVYNLFDYRNKGLYTAGPSEFLYLIHKASFIQTDSFHACIFAFIFGKPFLLYAREGVDNDMFSRIETLFTTLDLMRKYSDSGLKNELLECDYRTGYERLIQERERFMSFLRKSMEKRQ